MPLIEVDPSKIKFDAPSQQVGGLIEVDPSQIQFDVPQKPARELSTIEKLAALGNIAGNAMTMGVGKEIAARAIGMMPNRNYADVKQKMNQRLDEQKQATGLAGDVVDIGGSIAGGMAMTPIGWISKAPSALGQILRTSASAAPVGFAQGFANAAPNEATERGLASAGIAAATPLVMAPVMSGLGKVGKAVGLIDEAPKPTFEQFKQKSSDLYNRIDNLPPVATMVRPQAGGGMVATHETGEVLQPQFVNQQIAKLQAKVQKIDPTNTFMTRDNPAYDIYNEVIQNYKNRPMSIQDVQQFDERLSDLAEGLLNKGATTKQANAIYDLQHDFRAAVENMPAGGMLAQARKDWAKAMRMREIERIVEKGLTREQPAQAIKTGLTNLYYNPSRMRGYTTEEAKLIKDATKISGLADLVKTVGSRLPFIGQMVAGSPVGAAAQYAGSAIARDAATKMQVDKANRILRQIMEGNYNPTDAEKRLLMTYMGGATGAAKTMEAQ